MDYEKLHKDTITKLQEMVNSGKITVETARSICADFVPESEDERIRKEMIEILKQEAKDFPSSIIAEKSNKWIAWLEKQSEQKSNNVKPKFKIEKEKWYVCTQTYVLRGKIVVIKGQTYQAEKDNVIKGEDGCLFIDRHDGKASEYFRCWIIQDAKDGDVLAAHECLVLFKEIDGLNIRCYCTYHYLNHQAFYVDTLQNKTAFHPATKEQRDLLFQKMREAGY